MYTKKVMEFKAITTLSTVPPPLLIYRKAIILPLILVIPHFSKKFTTQPGYFNHQPGEHVRFYKKATSAKYWSPMQENEKWIIFILPAKPI